jgi:rhamnosyltransferase
MTTLSSNAICALIITFNPDDNISELVKLIESKVDHVIIVDNHSKDNGLKLLIDLQELKKVTVIYNPENYGIAKALNIGVQHANSLTYDWVLMFDQDSKPFETIIDILTNVYSSCSEKASIGSIGVNAVKKDGEVYYKVSETTAFVKKDYLITAGCLLSMKAFNDIGGFRDDFFIDNVDLEYSLRLRKNKYILLLSTECGMLHEAGNTLTKTYFGMKVSSSNHSVLRRYFMAKNNFVLTGLYLLYAPYFILKMNYFFTLSILKLLIVEDNRAKKMLATASGISDSIFGINDNKKYKIK